MEMVADKKGWVVLLNARKAHYFVEGKALCGKWMYWGSIFQDFNHYSSDNCVTCMRLRAKGGKV